MADYWAFKERFTKMGDRCCGGNRSSSSVLMFFQEPTWFFGIIFLSTTLVECDGPGIKRYRERNPGDLYF
jgi:hypothetical protein